MIRLCCVDVLSGIGRGLSVWLFVSGGDNWSGWVLLITSYDLTHSIRSSVDIWLPVWVPEFCFQILSFWFYC